MCLKGIWVGLVIWPLTTKVLTNVRLHHSGIDAKEDNCYAVWEAHTVLNEASCPCLDMARACYMSTFSLIFIIVILT